MSVSQGTMAPASTAARGLIFIVDDDRMVADVVEAILGLENYRTRVFLDPQLALAAFKAAAPRPALLFTDFVMDGLNGIDLIDACRRLDPGLKTILYSGSVGHEILARGGSRPDSFLAKPFQPQALLDLVRSVLAGSPMAPAPFQPQQAARFVTGKKLGVLLAAAPSQRNFEHGVRLSAAATAAGVQVYLYCIDDAVAGLDSPALQQLRASGLRLYGCAYAAQRRAVPLDERALFVGLGTLNDILVNTDRFIALA